MKDIKQCSISNVAFILEVDAYDTLYNYIESIRVRYVDNTDGEEIVADIEARVAELILSAHSSDRVVSKPLIDNIIDQLGSADDICDETQAAEPHASNPEAEETKSKPKRRFYRNIDDAPVGGVCSGIAANFGCDVVVVRLIALLLLFCWGVSIWVYVILWVVMPAAVTARQKLEMRGEPITVSTINDYYNSVVEDSKKRSVISSILSGIGYILMVLFKIFMVFILAVLLVAFVGVVISLFCVIVAFLSFGSWIGAALSTMALLSVGMLLALCVYFVIQVVNSRQIKGNTILAVLIVWLMLTITTTIITSVNMGEIKDLIYELHNTIGVF